MTTLCPSPKNEFGKGILSPEKEAKLLAQGYVFTCRVPGTLVPTRLVCKRPIADAVTDSILDSIRHYSTSKGVCEPNSHEFSKEPVCSAKTQY
jgi:hypothetical protein